MNMKIKNFIIFWLFDMSRALYNLRATNIRSYSFQLDWNKILSSQIHLYTIGVTKSWPTHCGTSPRIVITQVGSKSVLPDTRYYIRLCVWKYISPQTPSLIGHSDISLITAPPPPFNIRLTETQTNQINVTWQNSSTQARQYEVIFGTTNLNNVKYTNRSNNPSKQVRIVIVLSNSRYLAKVKSLTDNPIRSSSYSSLGSVVTVPGQANTPYPLSITSSSITMAWMPRSEGSIPRYYTIMWEPASLGGVYNKTVFKDSKTNQQSETISGLKSNFAYSVWLLAVNEAGGGKISNATSLCTAPAQSNPPEKVLSTSSSVFLQWKHVMEGPLVKEYTVTWSSGELSEIKNKSGLLGTSTEVTGLKSNTAFNFTLTASNKVGFGRASNLSLIYTAPSSISNFSYLEVADNTSQIQIFFTFESNDTSLTYEYSLFQQSNLISSITRSNSFYKWGLTPGLTYDLSIIVIGRGGRSPPRVIVFTTVPAPVKDFHVSRSSTAPSRVININWRNLVGHGSLIVVEYISSTSNVTNTSLFPFYDRKGSILVEPGSNYTIQLRVKSGIHSSEVTTSNITSSPPTLESVESVFTLDGLVVTWKKLEGAVEMVIIQFEVDQQTGIVFLPINSTNYTVPHVDEDSVFMVELFTSITDVNGDELRSKVVSISSPETIPAALVAAITSVSLVFLLFNLFLCGIYRKKQKQNSNPDKSILVENAQELVSGEDSKFRSNLENSSPKDDYKSKNINLTDFPEYMKDMEKNQNFKFMTQFATLNSIGRDQPVLTASVPENKRKNRYANILPYDHNRVKLKVVDGKPDSDYINASFVSGLTDFNCYICTQAPVNSTREDFWRMVWEQNCVDIVMLTKLVEKSRQKCVRYWPNIATEEEFPHLSVTTVSETQYSHYIIRIFKLTKDQVSRWISQFHFTSWPDKSVPSTTNDMVEFVRHVQEAIKDSRTHPLVVHCSAGVGRSGTFIAIDQIFQHLKSQGYVDIYGLVYQMRLDRTTMVQTEEQYIFIHRVVEDYLKGTFDISNIYDGIPAEHLEKNYQEITI